MSLLEAIEFCGVAFLGSVAMAFFIFYLAVAVAFFFPRKPGATDR